MRAFSLPCLMLLGVLLPPDMADAASKENRCSFSDGQGMDARRCLAIEPMQARKSPTLDQVERQPADDLRRYCPNVVLRRHDRTGKIVETIVELPEKSVLYDVTDCCPDNDLTLTTEPALHRFHVRETGRDCFGGTAIFDVEETYRLDKHGKASLIGKVDRTDEMRKALNPAE